MSNDLFPTTITIHRSTDLPDRQLTRRSPEDATHLRAVAIWDAPKMRGGRWVSIVNATDLATLQQFWAEHQATEIDFRWPWSQAWVGLFVGTGDGSTTAFDLPIYDGSDHTIKVDGSEVATVTIGDGTGANSRDRVTFTDNTPASNALVTLDATGYRQIEALLSGPWAPQLRGAAHYLVSLQIDEV